MNLEPVEIGQHDVEDHKVGPERYRRLQRSPAAPGGLDLKALIAQGGRDKIGDIWLVVDDQHPDRLGRFLGSVLEMSHCRARLAPPRRLRSPGLIIVPVPGDFLGGLWEIPVNLPTTNLPLGNGALA